MSQILVRDIDSEVVARLKNRALREGRSLQSEVKFILEQAAKLDMTTACEVLGDFRNRFKGRKFSDSARILREERER